MEQGRTPILQECLPWGSHFGSDRCQSLYGDVYMNGVGALGRWNRSSNTFTNDLAPIGQPASGNDSMSAFDTSRARIFVLGGQFSDHHLYTLSNNAFSAVTISGANASDVASVGQAAMAYVAAIDRFLVRKKDAGGTVTRSMHRLLRLRRLLRMVVHQYPQP